MAWLEYNSNYILMNSLFLLKSNRQDDDRICRSHTLQRIEMVHNHNRDSCDQEIVY
jgi:hypothetical protein